jgi:hypothetical protein
MFTPKIHNELRFYTLRITDTPEMAERMALDFEEKFSKLSKYDQVDLMFKIEMDGWEFAFEFVNN